MCLRKGNIYKGVHCVYVYVCMCIRLKVIYKMSTVSVRSFYGFFCLFILKLAVYQNHLWKQKNKIKSRCPSPISEDFHSMGSGFPLCLKTSGILIHAQCEASILK